MENQTSDWIPEVKVSPDHLVAAVIMPGPGRTRPCAHAVRQALAMAGVVFGVDEGAIDRAIAERRWGQAVIVARGESPLPGQDASVEYIVARESTGRPQERDDGGINWKELDIIRNVKAGDVLAVKRPASGGRSGKGVLGDTIEPRPGKECALLIGDNVILSSDGLQAVANTNGQLTVDAQGRMTVRKVFSVPGNVNMSTGNVKFVGSVIVAGSVEPGMIVEAEGGIRVSGIAAGDLLSAGSDIMVEQGIQGRGKGRIRASGNLAAKFIENADVDVDGQVMVRDAIMHSSVRSGSRVVVEGGRGVIVGGVVQAADEIRAVTIGSYMATPTILEVGMEPSLRQEITRLAEQIESDECELDKVIQGVKLISERAEDSTPNAPEMRAVLLKLSKHRTGIEKRLREAVGAHDILVERAAASRPGRVSCRRLFPGVRISMGAETLLIADEWEDVTVRLSETGRIDLVSGR